MRPAPFGYAEPDSIEDACALLARHGDGAAVLAGGQSLVAQLNARERRPRLVVAVGGVEGLRAVEAGPAALEVGAGVTQRALERHPATPPLLREALGLVGHVPTRNRGTVGGSLAFADPRGELPTAVLALGGQVRLRSTRGERTVVAADLWTGPFRTAIAPDELLTSVRIPRAGAGRWAFEQRDFRRHARLSAAAGFDGSRLVLAMGGVGAHPFLVDDALLAPVAADPGALPALAAAVADLVVPDPGRPDPYVSTDYRRRLAAGAATAALRRVLADVPVPTRTEAA